MSTENPWLQISVEDYEGHMSAPNVGQLQMLDKIFGSILEEFSPNSIAVLGCTAGNGFQHLINRNCERVVGVDINFHYLAECRAWFIQDIENLQLLCADLNDLELAESSFDLIHAALIFEYVEIELLLSKIIKWLKPGGVLTVVLQVPVGTSSPVSETEYQSLKKLNSIMRLIEPDEFISKAEIFGFNEDGSNEIELPGGKKFMEIYLKK